LRKIIKFFKNTTVKVVGFILILLFIASIFIFKDFYKVQAKKLVGIYYVYRGDKYYKQNQPQKAIGAYLKALKYYPGHYKARYNLASIYVSYEDYYAALDSYEKALEIKPTLINARIDYAIVLSEATFNYDKAIEEYNKAIELKPKWVYIPFVVNVKNTYKHNRGVAYYNLGLAWRGKSLLAGERTFKSRQYLENAVEAYENALKLKKTYQGYYNLGIVHHLLRNSNQAGYNYCEAIEIEPLNYEAHYNLAILLKDMRNYTDSMSEFQKAGLILDMQGDGNKTRYIYDVLNDVTRRMVAVGKYDDLVEYLNSESNFKEKYLTYINGRVLVSNDFDRAVLKNFKNCANKKFFEENKNEMDVRWK
jgi:tetratricopeptide (TPR) repeat protein